MSKPILVGACSCANLAPALETQQCGILRADVGHWESGPPSFPQWCSARSQSVGQGTSMGGRPGFWQGGGRASQRWTAATSGHRLKALATSSGTCQRIRHAFPPILGAHGQPPCAPPSLVLIETATWIGGTPIPMADTKSSPPAAPVRALWNQRPTGSSCSARAALGPGLCLCRRIAIHCPGLRRGPPRFFLASESCGSIDLCCPRTTLFKRGHSARVVIMTSNPSYDWRNPIKMR